MADTQPPTESKAEEIKEDEPKDDKTGFHLVLLAHDGDTPIYLQASNVDDLNKHIAEFVEKGGGYAYLFHGTRLQLTQPGCVVKIYENDKLVAQPESAEIINDSGLLPGVRFV